jgi:hypothetical protein
MRFLQRCLLASIFSLAASVTLGAADRAGWLNARDCGASGSRYQTTAAATAGSNQITVADVGDFKVGQGVMVSKCNVRYTHKSLWGPRGKYAGSRPLKEEVEVRGYDGSAGSWVVYLLDVAPGLPSKFRWTDDLGRTWHPAIPITYDWQPLSGGTEVRFQKFDWQDGYTVAIAGRDQLLSTIESIDGKVLTLRDPANRTAADAVVRHNDTAALQDAVDRAINEKKNLFVPLGHYSLSGAVVVRKPSAFVIEGENSVDTVLDLSEGEGSCLKLDGGTEATVRNFTMLGHMGFADRDQAGVMRTQGGTAVWGFYFKKCNAVYITATERVLVENCHARRMSMECFYSQGPSRSGTREPKAYTKAITYLRCSVEDCARNAFNNNDEAENTSMLYCRIHDVGGCSWEGASRFVRFIGNYVRNGGTVAMGNIRSRAEHLERLGSGQHIIADNVFESNCPYGGCMIRAAACATQVIVRNNIFVNFNSSAVDMSGDTGTRDLPAESALITGNIFDMTAIDEPSQKRTAVNVTASHVTVSDNQVYVRGDCDPLLTGISLREDALNLTVHDNLLRNCGTGIIAGRLQGLVGEVIDNLTFLRREGRTPPLARRNSHRYRGWNVVWLKKNKEPAGTSVIDVFDPETCQFKLQEPREMKVGDAFEIFPPVAANWNLHDNTVTACQQPIVLDAYGSPTSLLKDNLISRGTVRGVKQAVQLRGRFAVVGNQISGFDEPDSAALGLYPDRLGKPLDILVRGNIFQHCTFVAAERQPELWNAAHVVDNEFLSCEHVSGPMSDATPSTTP